MDFSKFIWGLKMFPVGIRGNKFELIWIHDETSRDDDRQLMISMLYCIICAVWWCKGWSCIWFSKASGPQALAQVPISGLVVKKIQWIELETWISSKKDFFSNSWNHRSWKKTKHNWSAEWRYKECKGIETNKSNDIYEEGTKPIR